MNNVTGKKGDVAIVPINVDRNVSPSEIRRMKAVAAGGVEAIGSDLGQDRYALVHSMFMTIQGEGPYAGHQAFFVRLGGCNLGEKLDCRWCDTSFEVAASTLMALEHVSMGISNAYGEQCTTRIRKLVVITGGEPLMQGDFIRRLIREMPDYLFQIETNGYYLHKHPDLAPYCVVSPKASTSLQGYSDVYEHHIDLLNQTLAVKFLLTSDPDSLYHEIPDWWRKLTTKVMVSPIAEYLRSPTREEGEVSSGWDPTMIDIPATQANYAYAANYVLGRCKEKVPLQISLQQHLFYGLP